MVWPVINDPAGPTSTRIKLAMSCGSPSRPTIAPPPRSRIDGTVALARWKQPRIDRSITCWKSAIEKFGGIDIVVNCAAILRDGLVFKGTPADWDEVVRNNLSAAYYLTHATTPVMRQQFKDGRGQDDGYDWGRIVNLVSTAAYIGNYGQASYASAKGGLTALMRITALDMARAGVTCNAVVPFAHTRVTEMIKPANDEQAAYKERGLKVPAEHVARLIGYLCSPAAQSVTGQILGVRGREVFVFSQPRPVASRG